MRIDRLYHFPSHGIQFKQNKKSGGEHHHPIQNDILFKFWRRIMSCRKFLENLSLPYSLPFEIRHHSVTCHFTWMHLLKSVFLPGHLGLEIIDISNRFIISYEFGTRKMEPISDQNKTGEFASSKKFYLIFMLMQLLRPQKDEFHYIPILFIANEAGSLKLNNLTNSLKFCCWFRKNFVIFHLIFKLNFWSGIWKVSNICPKFSAQNHIH